MKEGGKPIDRRPYQSVLSPSTLPIASLPMSCVPCVVRGFRRLDNPPSQSCPVGCILCDSPPLLIRLSVPLSCLCGPPPNIVTPLVRPPTVILVDTGLCCSAADTQREGGGGVGSSGRVGAGERHPPPPPPVLFLCIVPWVDQLAGEWVGDLDGPSSREGEGGPVGGWVGSTKWAGGSSLTPASPRHRTRAV